MKLHFFSLTVCTLLLGSSVWAAESSNAQAELARIEAQLAKNPGDVDLQVNRGLKLGALGRYEEELAQANKLIASKVSLRKAYLMQEHGYAGMDKFQESLESLNKAFLYGKASVSELLLKATLLIETKKYQEALTLCNEIIALAPNNAEAFEHRADCYYQLHGPCESSLVDLKKSAQLDPGCERVQRLIKVMSMHLSEAKGINK